MVSTLAAWRMVAPGAPLELQHAALPEPGSGEALIEVEACGLCHTDQAFLYGGVKPRAPLPLTLGHEILGKVVASPGDDELAGQQVIVPAVLPCGECKLCHTGRGNICRCQNMPGNDFDGGFASHCLCPSRYLIPVPESLVGRRDLAVVADAVGTAYQAVVRSGASPGDLVVVVGAGGVGTFAVQTAKLLGASVAAVDISPGRLEAIDDWVDLALDASTLGGREIKQAIVAFERQRGIAGPGRKIIECSGSAAGQQTAYSLLTFDARLMVVGYTRDRIDIRLSNLMAFDAQVVGNWGCLPEHFPRILELIEAGAIELPPFVELHPMSDLNELLQADCRRRPVLLPDF